MKKHLLISICTFIILLQYKGTNAQINYEQTYQTRLNTLGQEFFLTNLGNENYKYVIYDYDSARFSLYNLNHTPFMLNVQVPVVSNTATNTYYRLGYITTSLFDCDSTNIEYAIMLDSPRPSEHPNFAVYRTDGTLIFAKDTVGTVFCVGCGSGSYEMHPIMNTSTGAKLFLFNDSANSVRYFVYGLCGSLPETIDEVSQSNSFVKVFPNPGVHQINFEITAPSSYENYELTIYNLNFQTIQTNVLKGIKNQVNLDSDYLSSGTYFYSLQGKNKIFQTGKFVIAK